MNHLAATFRKGEEHAAGITDGQIADGKRRNVDDVVAAAENHRRTAAVAHGDSRNPERAVVDRKSDRIAPQVERQLHPEPLDVGQFTRIDRGSDQAAASLVVETEEYLLPLSVIKEVVDAVVGVVLDAEDIADLLFGIERKIELQIEAARISRHAP